MGQLRLALADIEAITSSTGDGEEMAPDFITKSQNIGKISAGGLRR